jgi:hypothetical protein
MEFVKEPIVFEKNHKDAKETLKKRNSKMNLFTIKKKTVLWLNKRFFKYKMVWLIA